MGDHASAPSVLDEVLAAAPCLSHGKLGSACRLDLAALKAEIHKLHAKRAVYQAEYDTLTPQVHVGRRGEPPTLMPPSDLWVTALGRWSAAAREIGACRHELRLLYATRAHHRGRVHLYTSREHKRCAQPSEAEALRLFGPPPRHGRWTPTEARIRVLLPCQALEVRNTWARFTGPPVSP